MRSAHVRLVDLHLPQEARLQGHPPGHDAVSRLSALPHGPRVFHLRARRREHAVGGEPNAVLHDDAVEEPGVRGLDLHHQGDVARGVEDETAGHRQRADRDHLPARERDRVPVRGLLLRRGEDGHEGVRALHDRHTAGRADQAKLRAPETRLRREGGGQDRHAVRGEHRQRGAPPLRELGTGHFAVGRGRDCGGGSVGVCDPAPEEERRHEEAEEESGVPSPLLCLFLHSFAASSAASKSQGWIPLTALQFASHSHRILSFHPTKTHNTIANKHTK